MVSDVYRVLSIILPDQQDALARPVVEMGAKERKRKIMTDEHNIYRVA